MPFRCQRGDDRQRPDPSGSAPAARRAPLERVEAELRSPGAAGRHEARPAPTRASHVSSAPSGAASRMSRSTVGARSRPASWPGASRIETFARAPRPAARSSASMRRAAHDPVHLERRLGERAQVELVGRTRIGRPCAVPGELVARRPVASASPASLLSVGGAMPARSGSGKRAVLREQLRSSVCISACAALSAAPPYMPECRSRSPRGRARGSRRGRVCDVERGHAAADHAASKMIAASARWSSAARKSTISGRRSPPRRRMAKRTLTGQLARLRGAARGSEQHVELALVVGGAAAVEVRRRAHLGLERVAVPELERVRRLDVDVPVDRGPSGPAPGLTPWTRSRRGGRRPRSRRVRPAGLTSVGPAARARAGRSAVR